MIAATLHWLLLAMWHANHLINSHVIGKLENHTSPKKHEARFYEWNGAFRTFGQIQIMSFGIQDGIHARLACITCRHLETIATNFLQFRFMNHHDFIFLPELSKMYWVGDLARFEQGSVG